MKARLRVPLRARRHVPLNARLHMPVFLARRASLSA